jgi:hypothetical protein
MPSWTSRLSRAQATVLPRRIPARVVISLAAPARLALHAQVDQCAFLFTSECAVKQWSAAQARLPARQADVTRARHGSIYQGSHSLHRLAALESVVTSLRSSAQLQTGQRRTASSRRAPPRPCFAPRDVRPAPTPPSKASTA